jgi:hypothetical protein
MPRDAQDFVRSLSGCELPPVSGGAQPKRQRDPDETEENQINPDEKTDHPKS